MERLRNPGSPLPHCANAPCGLRATPAFVRASFFPENALTSRPINPRQARRNPMPKIRHLAIKTKHPAKLAEFYAQVFDMKVIHSEKSGAVYLSDGYLTLAILRNRGEAAPSGINHFGFEVEDLAEVEKRLEKIDEPMTARPSTRPYAEHRAMDP